MPHPYPAATTRGTSTRIGALRTFAEFPEIARLNDGRLSARHGPIHLVITVDGNHALAQRWLSDHFAGILPDLASELDHLRRPPLDPMTGPVAGPVARRMWDATQPLAGTFITPMAAVAGAVADHVCAGLRSASDAARVIVNNGGDIALFLAPGETARIAICQPRGRGQPPAGTVTVQSGDGIGGVATSGWRGRSHSLGIADAATVLADTAAAADAAATLVANATDLPGHPAIARAPARDLSPDSDLGDRRVTTDVGPLSDRDVARALGRGLTCARDLCSRRLVRAAYIDLNGQSAVVSDSTAPSIQEHPR